MKRVVRYAILTVIAAAAACWVSSIASGQLQSIQLAVIPAFYSDQAAGILPTSSQLSDLASQVAKLWTDAAAGRLAITYSVAAPFAIDHRSGTTCPDTSWEYAASIAAANAGIVGSKGMFFTQEICRSDAALGGSTLRVSILNPAIAEHEFGHSLGLPHVYGVTFAGENGDFNHVAMQVYSDPDDVMGGGMYVDAVDLRMLGWFSPPVIARGLPPQTVKILPGARNAISVVRKDGIAYFLEIPVAGQAVRLRSNFYAHTWLGVILAGNDQNDEVGGVRFRGIAADTIEVSTFEPPPPPTPNPLWTPTPAPTYSTVTVTPSGPADCWVVPNYIRCSPTPPPPTVHPPADCFPVACTPTPNPTAAATAVPTELPTEPAWTITLTPTPSPSPTSTTTAAASPTPTPRVVPPTPTPTPKKSGGCASFTPFGTALIAGGLATWRRKLLRRYPRKR